MKNRLALPLILLALLAAGVWVLLESPAPSNRPDSSANDPTSLLAAAGAPSEDLETIQGTLDPQRSTLGAPKTPASQASAAENLASFFGSVRDQSGHPVADATVLAYGINGWAASWNGDRSRLSVEWKTTTNAQGVFAFPPTPHDRLRFLIEIHHPDFAELELTNQPAKVGRSRDLGTLALGPGFHLDGTVFDEQGHPIADAKVTPYRDSHLFSFSTREPEQRPLAAFVITDAQGRFSIESLPEQSIRLKSAAENFSSAWSSAINGKHGTVVHGVEIHLSPAQETSGMVLDQQRLPIANARVVVTAKNSGFSGQGSSQIETTTSADGHFHVALPSLSQDLDLSLTVGAEGYWVEETKIETAPPAGMLEVLLTPIAPLSGVVVDDNGHAVVGAVVSLIENKQGLLNPREMLANATTTSADDGSFTLVPNLRKAWGGRFSVYAWDDIHPVGQSEMFRLRNAKHFQPPNLHITLALGFNVSGKTLRPGGSPLANARIHLRALRKPRRNLLGQQPGTQRGGDIFAHTTSDAKGSFSFLGIAAGDYRLEAYHANFSPTESEDFGLVDRGFETQLRLVEACGIVGQIQGPMDGFRRLRVTASSPGLDALDTRVDKNGEFRFEKIMPGTWNLQLRDSDQDASGMSFVWGNTEPLARIDGLEVPPGSMVPATLQIDLSGRGGLSGTVKVNGAPAADFAVFVLPQMAGSNGLEDAFGGRNVTRKMRVATTDYAGRYALAAMDQGDYWVILCHPGGFPENLQSANGAPPSGLQRSEILLHDGAERNLDFTISLGSLTLKISNPSHGRTARARLIPDPKDGRRSHSFTLQRMGHHIASLAAGNYQLQIRTAAGWKSTSVRVPNQSDTVVAVQLPTVGSKSDSSTGSNKKPSKPR